MFSCRRGPGPNLIDGRYVGLVLTELEWLNRKLFGSLEVKDTRSALNELSLTQAAVLRAVFWGVPRVRWGWQWSV